jgi:MEMO1 family protein
MASPLARLRADLDVMPSPLPQQPGLIVRDPFRYSTATLVIPPLLAQCLSCFDGRHDEDDLRALLTRLTGKAATGPVAKRLVSALSEAGFLEDQRFDDMRGQREREFAAGAERASAHAGSGYPDNDAALTKTLRGYFNGSKPNGAGAAIGIAAPHVSPEGGKASYAEAYRALGADADDRIFVVAGTSHYGEPDRFGITRKAFATPFGVARTERRLLDRLVADAGDAVVVEDYCHAVEHSVEFQVVFLQYLFGPRVRIVPILCGAFAAGPRAGRPPEHSRQVARFLGALGEMAAREGSRLRFVLGVDFAHIGRRYGDPRAARAHAGAMTAVEERDRTRLARVAAGDAGGFWDLVYEGGDDELRWCGSSPLYSFLRAVPQARGRLLSYEHWNIDEASVVSFGAMAFDDGKAARVPKPPAARASRRKPATGK